MVIPVTPSAPFARSSLSIDLAITWNTDDINLFPINPMFGQQLIKAVGITRLQEYQCFAVFLGDEQPNTWKDCLHKNHCIQNCSMLLRRFKNSRSWVIGKFPVFPAQYPNNVYRLQAIRRLFLPFLLASQILQSLIFAQLEQRVPVNLIHGFCKLCTFCSGNPFYSGSLSFNSEVIRTSRRAWSFSDVRSSYQWYSGSHPDGIRRG